MSIGRVFMDMGNKKECVGKSLGGKVPDFAKNKLVAVVDNILERITFVYRCIL
jgi:hypothetical protein